MVEVHERVRGPEPGAQLIARDELTGTLEQNQQNVVGPSPKPETEALLEDITPPLVDLEEPESVRLRSPASHGHLNCWSRADSSADDVFREAS